MFLKTYVENLNLVETENDISKDDKNPENGQNGPKFVIVVVFMQWFEQWSVQFAQVILKFQLFKTWFLC